MIIWWLKNIQKGQKWYDAAEGQPQVRLICLSKQQMCVYHLHTATLCVRVYRCLLQMFTLMWWQRHLTPCHHSDGTHLYSEGLHDYWHFVKKFVFHDFTLQKEADSDSILSFVRHVTSVLHIKKHSFIYWNLFNTVLLNIAVWGFKFY